MALFGKKIATQIGVDFGVGGVKVVELKEERGRFHLSTYAVMQSGWGELEDSVSLLVGSMRSHDQRRLDQLRLKQIGSVVKQIVKKSRALGKTAIASIPTTGVFNAVIRLPEVPEKEFRARAMQEAVKLLPLPPEEMVLDFQKLKSNGEAASGHGRVLVTATSKVLVEEYTAIFKHAGLTLASLETESFALIRSLLGNDPAPAFVVDIGTARTNLFVVNGGIPLIHRSINFGGKHINAKLRQLWGIEDMGMIEQAKRDLSLGMPGAELPKAFYEVFDPIMKELKYNLDLYGRDADADGLKPEKIVLTGGSSLFLGVTRHLENAFNITTYIADPWARVVYPQALKGALDAIGARFAVAIGLASRKAF